MPKKPAAALAAKMKSDVEAPTEDRLRAIREVLRIARDKEREVMDLEERTKALKAEVLELKQKKLPDMFDEAKIDNLGLPAEGNLPPYDCKLTPYYHASIGADWDLERKAKAFAYLEECQAGDLIKSVYTISIPRGMRSYAKKVEAMLRKAQVDYETGLSVPWNTLTAWIKERIEKHNTVPALEVLGATVGQVVNIKERKSDGKTASNGK